jgi:sugar-phosphatase
VATWIVSGPAGSGKSTLGRRLAARVGATLLDLDTVTNPLLDAIGDRLAPGGHWNDDALRDLVRPARYACLLATARDQRDTGLDLVLVAPFTAELAGGQPWEDLRAALAPDVPTVIWIDAGPILLDHRLRVRGEARDLGHRPRGSIAPQVAHVRIDATLPTDRQVELALNTD